MRAFYIDDTYGKEVQRAELRSLTCPSRTWKPAEIVTYPMLREDVRRIMATDVCGVLVAVDIDRVPEFAGQVAKSLRLVIHSCELAGR